METPDPSQRRSPWAWFWAGTTFAVAISLAIVVWLLSASGLAIPLTLFAQGTLFGLETGAPPRVSGESVPFGRDAVMVTPSAAAVAGATPAASAPRPPTPTTASDPVSVRRGDVIAARQWRLSVNEYRSEPLADGGRRLFVDMTLKNDGDRAAVLIVPATLDRPPPASRAHWDSDPGPSWQLTQNAEPPTVSLYLVDASGRQFGGGFVGADGDPTGGYNFISAPGDAIRLTYAFALPASINGPLSLAALFGADAGGVRASVRLDEPATGGELLAPTDRSRVNGKEARLEVGKIWSLTALGISIAEPDPKGQRIVTLRLSAENLTDRPLLVGATLDDPTGSNRDFYAVDSAGRLAYSSADSMPRNIVPPRATRSIDIRLLASREFSPTGPFRVSVVVEPRNDLYAVFRFS